jgi:Tfp pilus assembly protein PilV
MNMKRNNSGFSMIEVLVASTIMIMIVMMLGMLFQQSSQAWRTGKQRADTYQQVRALFG